LKRRRAPASRSIQFFKYHRMYLATNPHAISLRLAATIFLTNEIPKKYFMVLSILLSLMACIYSNICCAIFMIQNDFARNIPSLFSTNCFPLDEYMTVRDPSDRAAEILPAGLPDRRVHRFDRRNTAVIEKRVVLCALFQSLRVKDVE
jgi:hypothetical protein